MPEKSFSFFPMIPRYPLPCAAAEEKRSIISWDLFPMGEQILSSAEILYGKIRSGNALRASWTIFLPLVSYLTGEEFQEDRRKDILGELLPDKEAGENQELVTREELRQIDSFQKNHTYMDEQLLYDHIKEGDAEYLEKQDFYEAPSHPIYHRGS